MLKVVIAMVAVVVLIIATAAFASNPNPNNGYQRLYFCADEDGHITYIENDRQIDCPGQQEILVMLGSEIKQP